MREGVRGRESERDREPNGREADFSFLSQNHVFLHKNRPGKGHKNGPKMDHKMVMMLFLSSSPFLPSSIFLFCLLLPSSAREEREEREREREERGKRGNEERREKRQARRETREDERREKREERREKR